MLRIAIALVFLVACDARPSPALGNATASATAVAYATATAATLAGGSLAKQSVTRGAGPYYVSFASVEARASIAGEDAGFLVVMGGTAQARVDADAPRTIAAGQGMAIAAGARWTVETSSTSAWFVSVRSASRRGDPAPAGLRRAYDTDDFPDAPLPAGRYDDELVLLALAPGRELQPHSHGGIEAMLALAGQLDLRVKGKPLHALTAGVGDAVEPDTMLTGRSTGTETSSSLVILATPAGKAVQTNATALDASTPLPTSARIEDLRAQFRYDAKAPLKARESGSARAGSVAVTELEYDNARGSLAKATLIVPDGAGKRPALVMSPGSNQARVDMRAEAVDIATAAGAIVLVVDQSQIAMNRDRIWTFTAQDREEAIESVVDLLRGVDLLAARPDVDASRIGLYAFSYGAWLSVIAAAVDPRITLLVLRSGGPQILRELAGPTRAAASTFAGYVELMASVDQLRYAPALPQSVAVLVQNGAADATYPADGVRAWQASIAGTKTARMYEGVGHPLDARANAEARSFVRDRWR